MVATRRNTIIVAVLLALVPMVLTGCATTAPTMVIPQSTWDPIAAPEGFPVTFPLVDGTLVEASPLGEQGWSVIVVVADQDTLDSALTKLTDNGYTVFGSDESNADSRSYSLTDGTTSVSLTLERRNGDFLASYSLAPAA